jgi:glycosyltransferase involved in cell wall biosynthesis
MCTDLKEESNREIKVLFFISSLSGGGAERVMVDILSYVDRCRIEPILVLLYPYDNSPYKKYLPGYVKVVVVKRKSDSFFSKIKQFADFIKTVRKENPRVILSMLTHNNIMAISAAMFFRLKVIVCEQNTVSEVLKIREGRKILWFPVSLLVKALYRFADRVIAVSKGVSFDLIEEFNVPACKIQVIYNPIDLNRVTGLSSIPPEHPFFKDQVPIIMAIGRLVRQKGFDTLLRAFNLVIQEMNARLIILGEGSEKAFLERIVRDLNLTDKVFFAGFQKNPYMFLSHADLFVLSSNFEGFSVVILEAMACGTPVIATDCNSGPGEILQDGKYGFLVPVGDEQAISKGIVTLLKDRSLREKFSRLARERTKDFSVDKIIKQYEHVIYEYITDFHLG